MYVEFGNDKAIEGYRDPNSDDPELVRYRKAEGQRITQVVFPEGTGLQEAFQTAVTALGYHIEDGERPTWVESDSEGLSALLHEHFGLTGRASRPKTWGKDTGADLTPPPLRLVASNPALLALVLLCRFLGLFAFLGVPIAIAQAFLIAQMASLELRTNGGADFQAAQMSGTPGAAANYIGLTANTAQTLDATQTALTGEITTGTLARAQATYAHTTGTNTYTLTKTFTSDQSVTIARIGVFNAASAGTMVFITALNATATLVSGDQLQITETVTL